MRLDLIVSGVGGQGIIFAARLLGWMALRRNWPVIGAETHGMAQRGGAVAAHLRFGGVGGSLVPAGSADGLIALKEEEAYRCLGLVRSGGAVFINAADFPRPKTADYVRRQKIEGLVLDADSLSLGAGLPRAGNLIMLAFACASGILPFDRVELERAVRAVTPQRFLAANLEAVELGAGGA